MRWYKKDIVNSDHIHTLSGAEKLLLEKMLPKLINNDFSLSFIKMREKNVSFSSGLDALFEKITLNVTNHKGFYVIKGFPSFYSGHSLNVLKNLILEFCLYLGVPLAQNKKKDIIFDVKAQEGVYLSTEASRGPQFREALAMHTDAGAILVMYCLDTANIGGHTLLSSAQAVYEEIKHNNSDLLDIFLNTDFYVDRRDQELDGALPYDARPIFRIKGDEVFCQYHSTFITDAQKKFPGIPRLSNEELDALRLFDTIALREDLAFEIKLEPGDIIVINNEKILHGRTAFDSDEALSSRHFLRLWLNSNTINPQFPHFLGY